MTSPQDDAPRPPAWAAPGGGPAPSDPKASPAPPPAPAPPAAPVPPPAWGAGTPGGWGNAVPPPPPPGGAWRPPALQPGIVPLRPLGLGEILDGAFKAVRANPKVMFGLAALVVSIAVIVESVVTWYVQGLVAGQVADVVRELDPTGETGIADQASMLVGQLLALPVTTFATTILTGLLMVSVSRSVLGRSISIGEALRSWRVWWVLGFTLLAGFAVVLAIALVTGAVVGLVALDAPGWAVAVGIVGLVLLVVGGMWFTVRTLLVTPALMLEGKGFWRTVGRAWRLTRGSFWRLLGIYLLVNLLVGIVLQIILTPVGVLTALLLQDPLGTSFASIVITGIGNAVGLTLSTTFLAAVVALLYIDVRMRREGLDIELGRAVQAGG
ncbi:glycerophosphoryl diester phosphodiesterase membrane domain-containing protein [Cellulomonas biazotea]|uniref:glycerophosphoryl diester phosphodiesterase membrane domain-containing protein n=2 Tax=Cellulomonas biazotea TaxID=1709 RepID=UPI0035E49434